MLFILDLPLLVPSGLNHRPLGGAGVIAFLSKQPAARLGQPRRCTILLPISLTMGLSAGPRAPHKKRGISWRLGASAPERLAAAELGYLRNDLHQAHLGW